MSLHARNLIGGHWQHAASGEIACSIDPSNGAKIGAFEASGRPDAEAAVSAARHAFERPNWSQNPRLRQLALLGWADRIERRSAELARLLTIENGKPLAQASGEITASVLWTAKPPITMTGIEIRVTTTNPRQW
ncbi:aldehyde dehydrogenase family protein [Bradyrhizobium sp. 179]|uniref:aldehyde dehydrogenase family protein n=1 Tax=Bradyrhizobium sp. 179 TaxID=2782648 RepID=UPI001FFB549D|nr:aldehyde dehydrogenase family protein [Bradyrhizobium sp. 179]MCK1540950.1 aldehyde dehydrogenase family protein [Bradyrhizobium sp. 179]